jgi:hypothetical protein
MSGFRDEAIPFIVYDPEIRSRIFIFMTFLDFTLT